MTEKIPTGLLTCDGRDFKRLAAGGLAWLEQNHEAVNRLNVFPVPDGDTGTNMLLTMRSAYSEIAEHEWPQVGMVLDKMAFGAIMGSRGNSGTILSQLLRGLAQTWKGKREFDAELLSEGMKQAVRLAYKAVQTPVEGTILTVAREVSEEVEAACAYTADLRLILARAVERAHASVAHTPDLLPILKKAGVVDSGGQGLAFLLEGMLRQANGEALGVLPNAPATQTPNLASVLRSEDERGYGYDVQYILRGKNLDLEAVRDSIGSMGDSMVVVGDSSLIKVHIHVHDPGVPISYGAHLGVISDVVVENMQEQSEGYIAMREDTTDSANVLSEPRVQVNTGDIAVIAVAPGEGLRRVLRDLGVAVVVMGGQTMNPSTEEFLNAINGLDTDKFIVLPNNKNIILAAQQAADLVREDSNRRVVVIPTRTVPQGITAMLSFQADGDFDSVVAAMDSASATVVTGEITTAVRSVEMDGISVEEGQLIGLVDGKLAVAGDSLANVVDDVLQHMAARDHEVITMYYGDHVRQAEANSLASKLRADFPEQEFDVIEGGQPYYQYILSAE